MRPVGPVVAAPLVKRPQDVLNGLILRPEIPQQFGWIGAKLRALPGDQFLNGGVAGARILVSYGMAFAGGIHELPTSPAIFAGKRESVARRPVQRTGPGLRFGHCATTGRLFGA
jgi:hypothetical protein